MASTLGKTNSVGRSIPRVEARAKVTGKAEYVHNLRLPGMLYGKVHRSTVAHGRIRGIDVSAAQAMPGVYAVYTAADIMKLVPDPHYGPAFHDQPVLAIDKVRNVGEPVALVLAAELPPDRALIYSHFMHTPGSVARYAALMRGIPFALSAHAKDIWTIPAWEKREKLADAAWAVTCTGANADHLRGLAADPGRVDLVYHGLDLSRFPPPPARKAGHDGRDAAQPVRLLSVGRLVAKKGYDDLLHALAGLPEGLHWRLIHIGGGDKTDLLRLAADLGIADKIDWRGAQAQTEVLAAYREADLFVLASRIAADGDRDGLPNVLMEAQSQGLACAATAVSAIPELIRDGETGLLVPPEDPPALAAALARLIADPGLRTRLGGAGQARVRADFGTAPGLDQLVRRLAPLCPPSP